MRRRLISSLIILSIILAFLFGNAMIRRCCTELTYPFQRILTWSNTQIGARLSAAWRGLCDGPMRDNSAIEIERLRVMLQTSEAIAQENAALRQTLSWQTRIPFQVIAARVTSHGGGLGVWPKLQLAVGKLHGIAAGDVVVVPDGLVGRIADTVTAHTSEVILLSDPACRVAVEVPGGTKGIVQGAQGIDYAKRADEPLLYAINPLAMRFVARNALLAPGQELYTEGSGGLFPRGIKVGTVLERHVSTTELLSEVLVEPAIDPRVLETVYVLIDGKSESELETYAP